MIITVYHIFYTYICIYIIIFVEVGGGGGGVEREGVSHPWYNLVTVC